MAENPNQPLVPNEAPPAYSPPAGAAEGYKPLDGDNKGAPAGSAGYQGGYQQGAPAGYAAPAGYSGQQPSYMQGGQAIIVQPGPAVVVVGGCPACRVGVLEDDFTCLGVCCAIVFFPVGLLCCFLCRQRRCSNCGAVFG